MGRKRAADSDGGPPCKIPVSPPCMRRLNYNVGRNLPSPMEKLCIYFLDQLDHYIININQVVEMKQSLVRFVAL